MSETKKVTKLMETYERLKGPAMKRLARLEAEGKLTTPPATLTEAWSKVGDALLQCGMKGGGFSDDLAVASYNLGLVLGTYQKEEENGYAVVATHEAHEDNDSKKDEADGDWELL